MTIHASIAANRFGLGARPDELHKARSNPKQWLIRQLDQQPPVLFNMDLLDSDEIMVRFPEFGMQKKADKNARSKGEQIDKTNNRFTGQIFRQLSADTIRQAVASENSLNWRLLIVPKLSESKKNSEESCFAEVKPIFFGWPSPQLQIWNSPATSCRCFLCGNELCPD